MERKNKKTKSVGNGEGSLYYSETLQCWIYQYVYNGKRKTLKQRKNEQSREFKKRVTNLKSSIDNGIYVETNKDTLLMILERFIEQKNKDGITSDRTYLRDTNTLEQIKKACSTWINKPIQKVTVENIEDSKENMRKYSNSTIDKIWILLKKGFKIAYSRRKISYNIMEDETLIKPISTKAPRVVTSLSQKEEKRLLEVLNLNEHKYNDILLLQLYTGMRIGEVLALSKDCINLKNNTITVYRTITRDKHDKVILGKHTKTYDKKNGIDKGKRTFPMKPNVRKIIQKLYSDKITNINNLLFWDYNRNFFITDGEINCYLSRLNAKYKILDNENETLSSHRLRHTFVTRCQENGLNLPVIQKLVGHIEGSKITNNVYTDISFDFITQELEKIK
ncbi:MAG: tyrosine-type recombinase/integrase [Clostridia bacterium]